jgi:alpha-glucuronidase
MIFLKYSDIHHLKTHGFHHWLSYLSISLNRHVVTTAFPFTAARAPPQVSSCGICGGQSDTGAGFLRLLLFFHRLLHTHHLSSGAGTIGQLVTDVPSGLSLTPPPPKNYKSLQEIANMAMGQPGIAFLTGVVKINRLVQS